ncbi:hypothetical protein DL96DRAFT_1594838 [Flagelloscypha sp. PMI_526]|nr:hypothetical protein DL96DRAFT_1594838 [Flagelloscypha sp. PMI_526]
MVKAWILFVNLPPDVAQTVVEFAAGDFDTARALLVTSKKLSQWAIPVLYTRVHLRKEDSAANFLAVLDSSSPTRGQYVRELAVSSGIDFDSRRNVLPGILAHTVSLRSFTWVRNWSFMEEWSPLAALPPTLRTLNLHFFFFGSEAWHADESRLNSAYKNIEELQVASKRQLDPNYSIIRKFNFAQFTSLKYLSIRSRTEWGQTSADFVMQIRNVLIPQLPPSLEVCVLYDIIWRAWDHGALSREVKELIMGYVDDRIILSTDHRLKLSPSAPYSDFLVRTSKEHPFVCSPWNKTSHTWEEIICLMEKRKVLRELWMEQFPRSEAKLRVKDYGENSKLEDFAISYVPVSVLVAGKELWQRIRS